MADVQSNVVLAGDYSSANVPVGMVLANKASYTIPASDGPGDGDKVEMVPIPKGAKILDIVVATSDTTVSLTLDVGDDGAVDRFLDGADASAALIASLSAGGDAANDGVGFEYAADDTIDIVFLGAAPTAGNVYTMIVTYVM